MRADEEWQRQGRAQKQDRRRRKILRTSGSVSGPERCEGGLTSGIIVAAAGIGPTREVTARWERRTLSRTAARYKYATARSEPSGRTTTCWSFLIESEGPESQVTVFVFSAKRVSTP